MHRESITEALLGTVLAFNTVMEIPAGTSLLVQIFGAGVIFLVLYNMLEQAREWEEKIKKARRAATRVGKTQKIHTLPF